MRRSVPRTDSEVNRYTAFPTAFRDWGWVALACVIRFLLIFFRRVPRTSSDHERGRKQTQYVLAAKSPIFLDPQMSRLKPRPTKIFAVIASCRPTAMATAHKSPAPVPVRVIGQKKKNPLVQEFSGVRAVVNVLRNSAGRFPNSV